MFVMPSVVAVVAVLCKIFYYILFSSFFFRIDEYLTVTATAE